MSSSKLAEAADAIKSAEKALSTSFFKRKPDYDEAAQYFEIAAKAYQSASQPQNAIDAFMRASDANYQNGVFFMAAKMLENAAQLKGGKAMNDLSGSAELYVKAAGVYKDNNNGDRAIEMMEKAAKCVEQDMPQKAIEYYQVACEWYVDEDRQRLGVETYKKLIGVLLRVGRPLDAVQWSDKLGDLLVKIQSKHLLLKNQLATVVILLHAGDEVAAGKRYESFVASNGFLNTDEGGIAGMMLEAFDKRDEELLKAALKRPQLNYIDNEVLKLARQLKVPGGGGLVKDAPPTKTTALCDDEEDDTKKKTPEETDDLC